MQLKISSITNLTDARFFSAIGADYLGFNFDVLNKQNISLSMAKEIKDWLHNPYIVGEFGIHQTKEEIEFIAGEIELNAIQLPYAHPQKSELILNTFLNINYKHTTEIDSSSDVYYVLKLEEADYTNDQIRQFISDNKVFIDAAFSKDNILSVLDFFQPFGIQLTAKKEEKPGWSAVDEYAELLEIIGYS